MAGVSFQLPYVLALGTNFVHGVLCSIDGGGDHLLIPHNSTEISVRDLVESSQLSESDRIRILPILDGSPERPHAPIAPSPPELKPDKNGIHQVFDDNTEQASAAYGPSSLRDWFSGVTMQLVAAFILGIFPTPRRNYCFALTWP
jgi:hypothetical protein